MPKKSQNQEARSQKSRSSGDRGSSIKSGPVAGGSTSYTAKDIHVLTGLEPVRKRPGMYIGSTGVEGLHHLIWEVFDNSLDEAMAGHAHHIEVGLLPDNKVTVADDGRGIPTDPHPKLKKSALELAATTLHAGGKFGDGAYKVSGGLHGVGLSVVNALSAWMRAEVRRKPDVFAQEYKIGKPQGPVKKIGKTTQTGTTITFQPDPTIFSEIAFNWEQILTHLRQQAYLTKGVRIKVSDERQPIQTVRPENKKESEHFTTHTFYFEGGIVSYVRFLNRHDEAKHPNIFYVGKDSNNIFVEVALQYTDNIQGKELSFANNVHTTEGGMHLTGFRSAITRTLNDYGRKNGFLKDKDDNLTGEDAREGLTVVVSVKLQEPQFEGQTKAKLGTPEARAVVETVTNTELSDWLERNPNDARSIMEKVMIAAKARTAAKAARDLVIRKSALEGMALPGKLADCTSRDPVESELFIVEGDSAGGCFFGETKVALLDGRNISFKDLVDEAAQGKQNYCYTIKKDGHVGVAPILHPRITKKNSRVLKVILDNGEEIICTPDHKFMLADGSYKEAQNLNESDSLMPLYRQYSKLGGRITIEGYELVFDHKDSRWIFTHMLADQYNLDSGYYCLEDGAQRHHKNFKKTNNNPDNLIRMSREAHFELHQKIAREVLQRPDVLEKLRIIRQSPEYREKISKTMLKPKMRAMLSSRAKKQWSDPEYKQFMVEKFLNFYNSNSEYRESNNRLLNQSQQNHWSQKANRQKQSNTTRLFFEAHPERKEILSHLATGQWEDMELRKWRSETTKKQWTDDFRAKRTKAYNETYKNKALSVFKSILENDGVVDTERYQEIRLQTNNKTLLKYETILERFFGNDAEKFKTAVQNYNHKIKAVVPLEEKVDVYDLEVPETHNFALASGVFVHNSSKQGRDRRTQAILPLKGKILNVEKARIDKMLGHDEIRALIVALGTAISAEFDITKIRYNKIILMADADVDGAHIRTLLLTLFFRYFPQIIEKGFLYIAQPPLYRIQKGSKIEYAYTDADKERIVDQFRIAAGGKAEEKPKKTAKKTKGVEGFEVSSLNGSDEAETSGGDGEVTDGLADGEIKIAGVSIQRYKGLGEMNPAQLWDTTMDPENRMLLKVTVSDAEKADEIFDILMGSDVVPRKKFIQSHAKNVKNLDI